MNINYIRNKIQQHYKDKDEAYVKSRQEDNRKRYAKYYHSKQWQTLRNNYYMEHPTCEICDAQGIVTQADEIHHKKKFLAGLTEEAKWNLLLNWNNLLSVCSKHHRLIHDYMRITNKDSASIDEILQYEKTLNSYS